jgi:alpha,alpha-trehalase
MSDALTSASMLALYGGTTNPDHTATMLKRAREILAIVKYGFPSWDPEHPSFESRRYWRGPVWAMMNYMIATGLDDQGEQLMAQRIRNDTRALISNSGYYEYFDPMTGAGCGGNDFTWTAAIQLALG